LILLGQIIIIMYLFFYGVLMMYAPIHWVSTHTHQGISLADIFIHGSLGFWSQKDIQWYE